jgi:hypothetical protein
MRYLSAAVAIAVVASLVSCDTGESGDPTEGTTSQAVSTKDARFADDAKDLRESISELLQDARRVRRGQPPTHKPAFLGYDFDCSDRVDPEGSGIRGGPRPLIELDSYSERPAAGSGLPSAKQFLGGSSELEH